MNLRDGLPTPNAQLDSRTYGETTPRKVGGNSNLTLAKGGGPAADTKQVAMGSKSIGGKYPPGMFMGGAKKENQDEWFTHQLPNGDFVAGVLDGHGLNGRVVSNYCKRQLEKHTGPMIGIGGRPGAVPEEVENRLASAVAITSSELLKSGLDAMDSGATSVTAIRRGNELWCANVGDSRCILAREGGSLGLESRGGRRGDKMMTSGLRAVVGMGGAVTPVTLCQMHWVYV